MNSALGYRSHATVDVADVVGAGARANGAGSAGVRGGRDPPTLADRCDDLATKINNICFASGEGGLDASNSTGMGISALLGGGAEFDQPSKR